MAPVYIGIEVFGDQQLQRRLNKFENRPRNLGGAYENLKAVFFDIEKKQFDTEGMSGSDGWAPLLPATIREKERLGYGDKPIMRRTDELFNSLTSEGSDWAGHYTTNEMFFGSRTPYGKYHQSDLPRRHQGDEYVAGSGGAMEIFQYHTGLPQRKVVDLTESNRRKMVRVFQAWLVEDDKAYDAKHKAGMGISDDE